MLLLLLSATPAAVVIGDPMAESLRAKYREAFAIAGQEEIIIRRYEGDEPDRTYTDYPARARVTGYELASSASLSGSHVQGERNLIVLAEDLELQEFAFPITTKDKVIVRGDEMAILAPDENTRRFNGANGALLAIEIKAAI